jgi:ergothioneine biosynthesis protein EgtB
MWAVIKGVSAVRNAPKAMIMQGLASAREYTLRLVDSLSHEQWLVPQRASLNPPLWELGHIGWFQERWCLRPRSSGELRESMLAQADAMFDSSRVAHATRWSLPLPSESVIREYLSDVLDASLDRLESLPQTDEALYFHRLSLAHELMHIEAFAMAFQALGYAEIPRIAGEARESRAETTQALEFGPLHLRPFTRLAPDRGFAGGSMQLGAQRDQGFVFDNEQWAHEVVIQPFEIELQPVINAEYLQFVNDEGYTRAELWDPAYFAHLQVTNRRLPVHWSSSQGRVLSRYFDSWRPIQEYEPVIHVSAFEAEAFCRWAGKRLPSEAEWQFAAQHDPAFDWGDRVWEWTATPFAPFPGFEPGPYADYSAPWFNTHRVLKGGSFVTSRSLVDSRFRNFYTPDRTDVFAGFRVCSAQATPAKTVE